MQDCICREPGDEHCHIGTQLLFLTQVMEGPAASRPTVSAAVLTKFMLSVVTLKGCVGPDL
jgi:hypothetical protein